MNNLDLIGGNGILGSSIKKVAHNLSIKDWGISSKSLGYFDLMNENSWFELLESNPKNIIFLSWPGLPNYLEDFHVSDNLTMSKKFLKLLFEKKINKIVIAGTCYEYGLLEGELSESTKTAPITKYGIAKDSLRNFVELEANKYKFDWCWLRVFYPYSKQNKKTLYSSLIEAIKNKDEYFSLGSGKQIRDFVPLEEISRQLLEITFNKKAYGIFNGGSGIPQSIKEFAYSVVKTEKSNIKLNFGIYKDREYESNSYWANMDKYRNLLVNNPSERFYK